jgi:outer membrane protein OmpA-like peptidoglycan-associated protein
VTFLLSGLLVGFDASRHPASSDELSVDSIRKALKPRKTRANQPEAPSADDLVIEQLVEVRKTRGLNLKERGQLFAASRSKPLVDMQIYFEFDSAAISPRAASSLEVLGKALTGDGFKGKQYIVGGHTDQKGTPEYNQGLSERRADAVKDYLVKHFGIIADDLVTVGYGAEHLKNGENPLADENRRVEIINRTL